MGRRSILGGMLAVMPAALPGRGRKKRTVARAAGRASASDDARARVRLEVDERRAQLIDLGLAEFGTRTFDEVSIDLIAKAAGISKGLLYHYFPTKRAFYQACVRESAARLLARMEIPDDVPPVERLRVGIERYLAYVRAQGNAFATLMRSGAYADPDLAAVVATCRAELLEQLTSGMASVLPTEKRASPLLRLALEGWIGLAEATSIAWVEECVRADRPGAKRTAPSVTEVRDLLERALFAIVESASR